MSDETCHLRMARFILSYMVVERDIIISLYDILRRGVYENMRKGD